MSIFTAQPSSVDARYDTTPGFPTEPAGWGQPGSVRHAENIGHAVWIAEHPDTTPDPESWEHTYDPGGRIDTLIDRHLPLSGRCPIPTCVRHDHPTWEMCEDTYGHTWFQGEPHELPADRAGLHTPGGIQQ